MIRECEILAQCVLPENPPAGFHVQRLVGDASSRSYFRIAAPSGATVVLMKMPEAFSEDSFPYLDNYHLLQGNGISLAQIYMTEPGRGYVFLQDLGDETFYDLYAGWNDQNKMLHFVRALDILSRISRIRPASRLAFDTEKFTWELNFFLEHFLIGLRRQEIHEDEKAEFQHHFLRLASELSDQPKVFSHRDYHSRNLMFSGGETYVIDFQDARLGPVTYDLASLLYDSYLQHTRKMIQHLERYYFTFYPNAHTQRWEYPRMCLQRNLKALGTFGYQASRLGRDFYLQFVGPTLAYVQKHLATLPEYAEMSKLLSRHLPELS